MSTVANPYASPETADLVQERDTPPAEPKIFSFSGRLGRLRLVTYLLVSSFISMLGCSLAVAMLTPVSPWLGVLAYVVLLLVSMVYGFSLYVRRLHDLGHSGIWLLLFVVPLANVGLLIYLLFFSGNDGVNEYGPKTVPNSSGVIVGFILGIFLGIASIGIIAAIAIPAYQDYVARAQM